MRGGAWLRFRRWTRREPQLVTRLIGLGAIEGLAQFNYFTSPRRDLWLHSWVTGALAAWALVSVALQAIARRDRGRDPARPAWVVADVAFLTLILWLFAAAGKSAVGGSLVVGYPAVVAASGLWFRVELVWLATALAEVGYGLLVIDARLRGSLWQHDHHPNIVIAAIALTGFVVARQVKRLLALSSYYEHRLPS
jgi:serine/threonine-protein kinase